MDEMLPALLPEAIYTVQYQCVKVNSLHLTLCATFESSQSEKESKANKTH